LKSRISCLLIFLLLSAVGWAKYSGGTGEPNDPYIIATPEDLNSIGLDSNDWSKHFKMIADINMSGYSYNTAVIAPDINQTESYFQGIDFNGFFDGNDHTVFLLIIDDSNNSFLGLFGYIGSGGEIRNLNLENFNLKGYSYVGAVAGKSEGIISNCFSDVNIQIDYNYAGGITGENDGNIFNSSTISNVYGSVHLGGIVGWNNGTIDKCDSEGITEVNVGSGGSCGGLVGYNKGDILNSVSSSTVYGGGSDVGGLAGTNCGTIEKCHSTGYVCGTDYSTGGLVGYNSGGKIYICYSNGDVSGKYDIGGLVGWNESGDISGSYSAGNVFGQEEVGGLIGWTTKGSITNCYSTGDVNGIQYIGGLSGGINSTGSINNCYAIGKVIGNENTGGLLGYNTFNTGVIIESFWDKSVNPDVNGIGNSNDPNVVGLPTVEMQKRSTFTDAGWDMVNVWDIGENQTYPFLRTHLPSDINKDNETNFFDLAILAENWLKDFEN